MGGDDSQKLRPWRGICSSPGRNKPPAHSKINTVMENYGGRPAPDATFSGQPGRGSATDCLGHFWKANLGHFSQAPKSSPSTLSAYADFPVVSPAAIRVPS